MEHIAIALTNENSLFSQESLKDLLLITIPTLLLAAVTLWDNDRMYKVAMKALTILSLRKKEPEFHGRHEKPEGNSFPEAFVKNNLTRAEQEKP